MLVEGSEQTQQYALYSKRKGGREGGGQEGARIAVLYIKNTITEISSTEKFKGKVKEDSSRV